MARARWLVAAACLWAAGCDCGGATSASRCSAPEDCPEGTCVDGRCVSCVRGTAGCLCEEGKRCGSLLVCREARCADCQPPDACPCAAGSCGASMVCDLATATCRAPMGCAEAGCQEHQQCAPEGAAQDAVCLPSCEPGFAWNEAHKRCDPEGGANCDEGAPGSILADCQARNRLCEESAQGAACADCLPFFVDEGGALESCRAVKACDELACGDAHRVCVPPSERADAACGACAEGFVEREGACVEPERCADPGGVGEACALQNRDCVDQPSGAACGDCLAGSYPDPGGREPCIAPLTCGDCAALNRLCEPLGEGQPVRLTCGACLSGLVPADAHPNSLCRPRSGCPKTDPPREGDRICPEGQVCVEAVDADSRCVTPECPPNQAFSPLRQRCVACGGACTGAGETGAFWPFTDLVSDKCVCETRPGWFADLSGSMAARRCDADGDGWVRASARDAVLSSDPTLRSNARCVLRWIDRVALQNEYGQTLELLLCQGRPAIVRADTDTCAEARALALAEPERLDDDAQVKAFPNYFPAWGGRRPVAAELNPLTKACVSVQGDFNFNEVADVDEWQAESGADPWRPFAYFVELHRGWFEPRPGGRGRYVVRERSRCDEDFPLKYGAKGASGYWRNCARRRDAAFDASSAAYPLIGFDFAAWSCLSSSGSCPVPPPPAQLPPGATTPPPHGLCEVPLPPQPTGGWRGMHHHSQFKCVVVDSADPPPGDKAAAQRHRYPIALFDGADGARLEVFNRCGVRCPILDPTCATDCVNGICSGSWESPLPEQEAESTRFARIACEAVMQTSGPNPAVGTGSVGFVAQRFRSGGPYVRGCIDEWFELAYRALCPGYDTFPQAVTGTGEQSDFGRLACGCSERMGGYYCELGCPADDLLLSVPYKVSPRTGTWVCGRLTTLDPASVTGGEDSEAGTAIWELRGSIETVGASFEGKEVCASGPEGEYCLR